ncbi:MAG TPA: hypothetical protein PKC43_01670 [Phycisphaerales bacterium]|nr:hypothetical protein [Phycisphaerales bacterium]HMP36133.1 hypothetical protein [Phycisphaerales bacterium]
MTVGRSDDRLGSAPKPKGAGGLVAALLAVAIALMAPIGTPRAAAQTPVYGLGAMQPSTGHFYVHTMVNYRQFDGDDSTLDRDVRQVSIVTQVAYALLSNVSVNLDIPVVFNHLSASAQATGDSAAGFGDIDLSIKWRVWQHDTGPTDTMRFALIGGLQMPGGTTTYWDSTEEGWNPFFGGVFSIVQGRHGGNASLLWEFDTAGGGNADGGLQYDLSYLYRLAPAVYGEATSHAAWYFVAEINGLYETNGNDQLFLAPGIMYEATWWTLDAGVMIPVYQDLKDRPETEIAFGVGLRLSF